MVAVVGKMFPGSEAGKATDNPVTLDGGDPAVISPDHPLPTLHGHGEVAAVEDGDVVNEGMGLVRRGGKSRAIIDPVDAGLESLKKSRLHA
jgi:hypothetical protein